MRLSRGTGLARNLSGDAENLGELAEHTTPTVSIYIWETQIVRASQFCLPLSFSHPAMNLSRALRSNSRRSLSTSVSWLVVTDHLRQASFFNHMSSPNSRCTASMSWCRAIPSASSGAVMIETYADGQEVHIGDRVVNAGVLGKVVRYRPGRVFRNVPSRGVVLSTPRVHDSRERWHAHLCRSARRVHSACRQKHGSVNSCTGSSSPRRTCPPRRAAERKNVSPSEARAAVSSAS